MQLEAGGQGAMREGQVAVAGRFEADHDGPSDHGELLGNPIIVGLRRKHGHAPASPALRMLDEHLLTVLRHIDRNQHGVRG